MLMFRFCPLVCSLLVLMLLFTVSGFVSVFVARFGPFHVILALCLFGLCVWFVVVLLGPG